MEGYLMKFMLIFTTPNCYDEYLVKYNFFDGDCFKASLSKTLGSIIILGSLTVKFPQILKIIKNGSVEGINFLGVLLDLFAMTANYLYAHVKNFPFSSWGEILFLAVQTAVIAMLILHYTRSDVHVVAFLVGYVLLVYVLAMESLVDFLWFLQIANLPVVIAGKGLQILSNYKNKSTGQLSVVTIFMQFAGTAARIFTSIQETGDVSFILSFVICCILNGTTLFQCFLYKGEKETKKSK